MRPISYRIGYKVIPKVNLVEVHPKLSNIGHPVDGALAGAGGSLWPKGSGLNCWWSFMKAVGSLPIL
jgi:hypothetical protein